MTSCHLCDDNVAVSTIPIPYHVIQEVLGNLCGLTTPCAASDYHHLVSLQARYDVLCLQGYREGLAAQ